VIDAQNTTEMFTNMLIATGILIGAVAVLVIVGFVVYHKTAGDRHETENAP
jgi:hypothetical protein